MSYPPGMIHRKLPPDAVIHTRQPVPPAVPETPEGQRAEVFEELLNALAKLTRLTENRGFPVDEYETTPVSGAGSSAAVTVLPTYEYMWEKIESVLITGPPGNITVLLGDRQWALTIPATGYIILAPLALRLSRADARILTPATPGTYSLELMGIADRRYNI